MGRADMFVVVNPVAAGGRTVRLWPSIQSALRQHDLSFEFAFTSAPGEGIELARRAALEGYRVVVALGGDGTINEVANGLMLAGDGERAGAEMGLIMAGRGCDFARTVGVPADYQEACARLAQPRRMTIDVGLVHYHEGERAGQRYFVNVGGGGFDGEVAARANCVPRFLGGTVPYLTSLVLTLFLYRNKDVQLTLDDEPPRTVRVYSVIVANCQYFGGGMRIAPDADPNDGLFDVVILGNLGKIEFLRTTPTVYEGTHVQHPKVSVFRAREVDVQSEDPLLLQVEGEVCGHTPLHFALLPQALTLRV